MPPVIDIKTKMPQEEGDVASFSYYRAHGKAKFQFVGMTLEDACFIDRMVRSWKDKLIDELIQRGITT